MKKKNNTNLDQYTPVMGLEMHVELTTTSKMFCGCPSNHFKAEPNSQTCPVCLGMPGTLPVANRKALELSIKIAHALNCRINEEFVFARKHYFYPDLPKGYQITQFQNPVGSAGYLEIEEKKYRINRVHIEEDTGKLIHQGNDTLVDFNRAGVALIEIVTEPDFNDPDDVVEYFSRIRNIVRALNASSADMEKGQMRLEPNISLKKKGEGLPRYKVEVKNINSFKFVKKAILFEIERQKEILSGGELPIQETRGFDPVRGVTFSQRLKEDIGDYKYFPEPDIPPIRFSKKEVRHLIKECPELPHEKVIRYQQIGVSENDAKTISKDHKLSSYFESVLEQTTKKDTGIIKHIAKLLVNNKLSIDLSPSEFISRVRDSLRTVVVDEKLLRSLVEKTIKDNIKIVEDYKNGKENAINVLIGFVIRDSNGKLHASAISREMRKQLCK